MYVPGITNNLLSVVQLVKDNAKPLEFTSSCCLVKDRVKQELRGTLLNGLYRLSLPSEHTALLGEITPAYIWHLIYLI
jgi:hypothetical protein